MVERITYPNIQENKYIFVQANISETVLSTSESTDWKEIFLPLNRSLFVHCHIGHGTVKRKGRE